MSWVPNTVVAKVHNKTSFEDGFATEELAPGMGVVIEENEGESHKTIAPAPADSQSTRVVREPRNPPQPVDGDTMASPLTQTIPADRFTETVGFVDQDEARCRIAYEADGEGGDVPIESADLGWDGNGNLTTAASTAVARGVKDLSGHFESINLALVEFY